MKKIVIMGMCLTIISYLLLCESYSFNSEIVFDNVEAISETSGNDNKIDTSKFSKKTMYQRDCLNEDNNTTYGLYWGYLYRNGQIVYIQGTNLELCGGYGYATNQLLKDENGNQLYCWL